MTKKDYELIAKCIQFRKLDYRHNRHATVALELLQESLASNFELKNPRFDTEKFHKACSIQDITRAFDTILAD